MNFKLQMQIECEKGTINEQMLQLLEQVASLGSLKAAAAAMGLSYKNAWDKLKLASLFAGEDLLETSSKKSGAKLSQAGKRLLDKYERFHIFSASLDNDFSPKLSAQNRLSGPICSLDKLPKGVLVSINVLGTKLSALITSNALKTLKLSLNQNITFIFKAYSLTHKLLGDNLIYAKVLSCQGSDQGYMCELDYKNNHLKGISQTPLEVGTEQSFEVGAKDIIIML